MQNYVSYVKDNLDKIYAKSPFVTVLGIRITDIKDGEATGKMPVSPAVHANFYNIAHGGSLVSLADTVMGIACLTTGKQPVTLDINMNYIRAAQMDDIVSAVAKVIHNGKSTLVLEAELVNAAGRLIAKARGTFFVSGNIDSQNE
ncbi:MAG: phenylacetic acid degradation-related protein [Firmicutes bacterium]|nr:phenylacetic acid degradation-related protein [Bacillota bacterium]